MIRLRASAKINLALRVGSRADDGYHPVATVLQTLSLSDLLYARLAHRGEHAAGGPPPAEELLQLRVDGAELSPDNTVRRAVAAMAAEARDHGVEPLPLAMRLVKRIPLGAGLGGGSSDAVAAMAACSRLWRLETSRLEESGALQRIAEQIGSDVPFFLLGGTALGTGRGARVELLDPLPATWFVVAAPPLHVSTPDAYAAFDRDLGSEDACAVPVVPAYEPVFGGGWMGNDLSAPVAGLHPEVEAARRQLGEVGGDCAQMTGSGAASFAGFSDRRAATRAARRLQGRGLWAGAFVSITGNEHRRSIFGDVPTLTS
ncbi:MAG: 4-(cytidine 5'-diphospho)-2-C-methyl-D-erythritol kinase [Acidobacteria bacterium]|nr:4-(cytidine 5'-diphospho)-2-C-methyl-D-erythritol kinase [Acidobacteriota bacterium]